MYDEPPFDDLGVELVLAIGTGVLLFGLILILFVT